MINEEWRNIIGFENKYQVSNIGNIRNKETNKLLKYNMPNKYLRVCLYKNGKRKNYMVHRLVAQAFIPNPDILPQVNHRDENKLNNCVDNLEWCNNSYNQKYGTKPERVKMKLGKKVNQYDLEKNFIKQWNCTMDIQRELGISNSNISYCCNKKIKQSHGYIWEYESRG